MNHAADGLYYVTEEMLRKARVCDKALRIVADHADDKGRTLVTHALAQKIHTETYGMRKWFAGRIIYRRFSSHHAVCLDIELTRRMQPEAVATICMDILLERAKNEKLI